MALACECSRRQTHGKSGHLRPRLLHVTVSRPATGLCLLSDEKNLALRRPRLPAVGTDPDPDRRRGRAIDIDQRNAAVRQSGITGIADTQCGFKLFRRTVAQDLFGYTSINGFGFDLELLYLAQRRGYRIAEVPVNWSDQPGSKVHVLKDGLTMLRDLAAIRRNHQCGRYGLPPFSHEFVQVGASRFRMPAS